MFAQHIGRMRPPLVGPLSLAQGNILRDWPSNAPHELRLNAGLDDNLKTGQC